VKVHGEIVEEIVLTEPTARHLRALPIGKALSVGTLLDVAANVSGWPPSAIDQLNGKDTFAVVEALSSFLDRSTAPSKMPPS
jgi:hypothetical protein